MNLINPLLNQIKAWELAEQCPDAPRKTEAYDEKIITHYKYGSKFFGLISTKTPVYRRFKGERVVLNRDDYEFILTHDPYTLKVSVEWMRK